MSLVANGNESSPTSPRNHRDSHNKRASHASGVVRKLGQRSASERGLENKSIITHAQFCLSRLLHLKNLTNVSKACHISGPQSWKMQGKNPCGLPQRIGWINKLMFIKNLNYLSEMLLFKLKQNCLISSVRYVTFAIWCLGPLMLLVINYAAKEIIKMYVKKVAGNKSTFT